MAIDRDGDGPSLTREDTKPRSGGDDLRATPFTDDVFNDDDYYGRRPAASKGGRSFTLIAGVVIGVAIVGGVAWYAMKGGAMNRLVPGDPQTVEADPSPYKIKPENPGGMQVENQDKLVYDRVAKGAAPNRVENLLPPAEEPKAPPQKPKAEPEPAKVETAASADAEKKQLESLVKAAQEPAKAPAPPAEPAKVEAPKAAEPPKPVQVAEAPKVEPPKPVEAPKPAAAEPKVEAAKPDPLVAAVAAATGKPVETPKAEAPKAAEPPKPAPPVETKTAAVTPAAAPVAGAFQIQLVSVPSEDAANSEWKRISRKHQDLAALTPTVTKAELPEKGTVYRLRAGPLPDKAAADALCAALTAEKTGCIVIKP